MMLFEGYHVAVQNDLRAMAQKDHSAHVEAHWLTRQYTPHMYPAQQRYYGCTHCQKYHQEGTIIYEKHIGWQDKNGIKNIWIAKIGEHNA